MEARLMELESRFAFQEDALNQLSDQLFEQRKQIELLNRRLEALLLRLDEKGILDD